MKIGRYQFHPIKNSFVNWFIFRIKRRHYGKTYKSYWQDGKKMLKPYYEKNPILEKYAIDTANYIKTQVKTGRILEYGCGFGRTLKKLEGMDNRYELYGIDISEPALKIGKNYTTATLKKNDGVTISFPDNFFDLSFTFGTLEHVPENDFRKICNELIRVTKKIIVHYEGSRTYYTKYPHNYKKFYKKKGFKAQSFKLSGFNDEFTWYKVLIREMKN